MKGLIRRHRKKVLAVGIGLAVVGLAVFHSAETAAVETVGAFVFALGVVGVVVAVKAGKGKPGKPHTGQPPQGKSLAEFQKEQVETTLEVLNGTMELIKTSKKLDVLETRREFGLERSRELLGMEQLGVYRGRPSAQEFIEFFETEALAYINRIKNPTHYDAMSGHEFESFCAELLKGNGFTSVEVTSGSGDFGVDILAEKDGITYAIQCKRQSGNVGNTAVQEIYSGKEFYKKHVGAVMTNQHFTRSAKETAERTGIILWDRDRLDEMIGEQKESAMVYNSADYDSAANYDSSGADRYTVSTSGDERVCHVCASHDGKTYSVKNMIVGENHPPFHEKCRCVALPVFPWEKDNTWDKGGQDREA